MNKLLGFLFLMINLHSIKAQEINIGLEAGMNLQHLQGDSWQMNDLSASPRNIFGRYILDERTMIGAYVNYEFIDNLAAQFALRHYYISYDITTTTELTNSFIGERSNPASIYGPAYDFSLALRYNLLDLITLQAGAGINTYQNVGDRGYSNLEDYPELLNLNKSIEENFNTTETYLLLGPTATFGRFNVNVLFQIGLSPTINDFSLNGQPVSLDINHHRVIFNLGYDLFRFKTNKTK
ncbi:MAG: hypothetical protein ACOCXH_00600 [Cyclobacteriaceae bacterium]